MISAGWRVDCARYEPLGERVWGVGVDCCSDEDVACCCGEESASASEREPESGPDGEEDEGEGELARENDVEGALGDEKGPEEV